LVSPGGVVATGIMIPTGGGNKESNRAANCNMVSKDRFNKKSRGRNSSRRASQESLSFENRFDILLKD
jgi:hypothetical protein